MYNFIHFLGSGPNRGQSPVEWGEIPSVRPYVRPSPLWLALRPCWLAPRPLQLALRPCWLALRPLQPALTPLQQALKNDELCNLLRKMFLFSLKG